MILGKIWGSTEPLLKTPMLEVHRLSINPRSRCSLHAHQYKWNAFMVLSGRLSIEVHKNDYALIDITELRAGEFTTVKPGEYHRFVSHDDHVLAFELYYPEQLSEDIVRRDCGGMGVTDVIANLDLLTA